MFGSTASTAVAGTRVPEYDHTQWSPMNWILLAPAGILLVLSIFLDDAAAVVMVVTALALGLVAYSFRSLRVFDYGNALALQFGPLPIFRKRFAYAEIVAADCDRSSVIDGWGMHWAPGRGWTYNLWGFDCVRLELTKGRTVRVGTDDPEGLAQFLKEKCRQRSSEI
jgi:hypothetical protein